MNRAKWHRTRRTRTEMMFFPRTRPPNKEDWALLFWLVFCTALFVWLTGGVG